MTGVPDLMLALEESLKPKPITRYFTFGPDHERRHKLERNTVVKITALDPRAVMFELYGNQWCTDYTLEQTKRWRTPLEDLPVLEVFRDA